MMTSRLLVLQDSLLFGGHELMFLRLLPAVLDAGAFREVVIRFPQGNQAFRAQLEAIGSRRLRLEPWEFSKRAGEPYFASFRHDYRAAVSETIARERPRTTLLLQGRIENCAVPMLAIPSEQFVVSYLPMAHSMGEMGRNGLVGDWVRRRLYRRPDRFVVPSQAVVDQLARAGARSPAIVVENSVDGPLRPGDDIRAQFGLPPGRKLALFLGRFDAVQKGLDLLANAVRRSASMLGDWTFLFVGDGPAREEIESLDRCGVDIRIVPWTDRPLDFLQGCDLMLLPSRYEGVPLVMLQALSCGLPILASNLDVFRDYLPEHHRTDFTTVDLAGRMAFLTSGDRPSAFAETARARLAATRLDRSRELFAAALHESAVP